MRTVVGKTASDSIFDFVDDARLRALLESYHAEAGRALAANAYLGTITACGGVLEGLLTWRLLQTESEAHSSKRPRRRRTGAGCPCGGGAWLP